MANQYYNEKGERRFDIGSDDLMLIHAIMTAGSAMVSPAPAPPTIDVEPPQPQFQPQHHRSLAAIPDPIPAQPTDRVESAVNTPRRMDFSGMGPLDFRQSKSTAIAPIQRAARPTKLPRTHWAIAAVEQRLRKDPGGSVLTVVSLVCMLLLAVHAYRVYGGGAEKKPVAEQKAPSTQ